MRILLLVTVGLAIGSVSGTLGIGGGVLLMPALIWLFGFDHPKAAGTTLAILALPVGLWPAVWKYYEQGLLNAHDLKAAFWIAGGFALGAFAGASVVTHIPKATLQLCFGLLLVYIGTRFVVNSHSEAAGALSGLSAAAVAWLAYLGLRVLGEKYMPRPDLGEKIRQAHQKRADEPDYTI